MRRLGLLGMAVLLGMTGAVQAQTSTWAFSKDTVGEVSIRRDSVSMVNNGTEDLQLDSITLERIGPTAPRYDVAFYIQTRNYHLIGGDAPGILGFNPNTIAVNAGQSVTLNLFSVQSNVAAVTKSSIALGDSLTVRMIFYAAGGRGSDTLIVTGKEDIPVALRAVQSPVDKPVTDDRQFDLRGRNYSAIGSFVRSSLRSMR